MADRLAHAPHLAVAALVDRPGGPRRGDDDVAWAGAVMPSSSSTPSRSWRIARGRRLTVDLGQVLLLDAETRVGQPVGQVAVVGEQQQALGVEVEPTDREHPRLVRHEVDHRRSTLRIVGGGDHAGRLVQQVVDEPGTTPTAAPSTSTRSCSGSTRRPSTATSPLTVTRPSAIRSSQTRRLPSPARARTFCSRSPSVTRHRAQLSSASVAVEPSSAGGRRPARRR